MSGPLRIGSVCTGYGGLDMAVAEVFGGRVVWVADPDPGASAILAHRFPGVPNLGDIRAVDWAGVEPVDVVIGGYPCQPFSLAGELKGTADERHLWPDIARALGVLRPRYAIFENVANHLRIGFDTVLCDLAGLGFDAEWGTLRASDVGAPHPRKRLFVLAAAAAADAPHKRHERGGAAWDGWAGSAHGRVVAADAGGAGLAVGAVEPDRDEQPAVERGGGEPAAHADGGGRRPDLDGLRSREPDSGGGAVADPAGVRRGEGRPEPTRVKGRPGTAGGRVSGWGRFAPAVAWWEAVTGRPAPGATDHRGRLNPRMVEWMMGLPDGWVTDVPGLTRTQQLRALGNGVVPQQAAHALNGLTTRLLPAGEVAA
ncbi:DNA cytosine methyltransferase [Streptomyces sp. MS19]|uniref:DNA cytosine methyltransferase n=1 Tax=Streptomyces sp. MS19 TaxID=3385972 RepID=UPI0039A2FA9A